MLISTRHAYGAVLEGPDGRLGALYDILFDDQSWKVRHLLVSRDRWFHGRQVLVDPAVIERADWPNRKLSTRLTKEEIERCPGPETDEPVDLQNAGQPAQVLVWEAYWTGVLDSEQKAGDSHLRSTKVLNGLHIHCIDGMFGHVDDFLVDDQSWSISNLVVETRNWWPGKHLIVAPSSIRSIDWEDGEIFLSLTREEVLKRPTYEGGAVKESAVASR
ncbi:MAG: hypothetical protein LLG00_00080 [Planctomycetaceae bacterium]|nr:hypothetical protein [Planctomycetaceae bacterium]